MIMPNAMGNERMIGYLDSTRDWGRVVSAWAKKEGASSLFEDDIFGLWVWSDRGANLSFVRDEGVVGLVLGDIFRTAPSPGTPSPSPSMREWLAQACRREDPELVWKWVGQFSVVLLDLRRGNAILYRDDSASRFLYYQQHPLGGAVFSNRLDLLVSTPAAERRLSRSSVHEYLRFLDISTPNTIYDRVFSTEPGAIYRFYHHGVSALQPNREKEQTRGLRTLETATENLDRQLREAVADRVTTDGSMVSFLSGGVDSSLLCSIAARLQNVRVEAVTVGFEDRSFDESQVAKAVAAYLKIPHHVLTFPMSAYRDAFQELAAGVEFPFADPATIPTLLAFRRARQIGAVAFDGTGADGLFGGMPARHQRIATAYGSLLPRKFRQRAARLVKSLPIARGYAPLIDFDEAEEVLIRWQGWTRREIESLCGEPVSFENTRFYKVFRTFSRHAHYLRYSALLRSMPDDRLHQVAMLTDLALRFPYMDPTVRDYVGGMDLDLLYRKGESKRVLKAVLERYVPRGIWDVPKHGFDFPFVPLMSMDDYALVREHLNPARTRQWGLIDQQKLDMAVSNFIRGDRRDSFRIWALVVLFAWLENHYRNL